MTSPRTFFGPPQSVSGHVPHRGRRAVSCTSTGQVIACAFYFLLPLPPPRTWRQLSKWERRLRKTELPHPAFPVAGTGVELRGSVPAGERTDLEIRWQVLVLITIGLNFFFLTENYAVLTPNTFGKPRVAHGWRSELLHRETEGNDGRESHPTWSLIGSNSLNEPDTSKFYLLHKLEIPFS